jgi:antitoxin (DNA-binding transcriptional repressor) of toxin-antitoxin stability system
LTKRNIVKSSVYTVHQAKTQLSRLIEEALKGHEVVIARGKTPVAQLVALNSARKQRRPGRFQGKGVIHPSFFDPMTAEELKEWGIE